MKFNKLFVDQYGCRYFARTYKELKQKYTLPGRMQPMYCGMKDGKSFRTGVIIGRLWLDEYYPRRDPL
jgi:hypothetical protein